MRTHPIKVHQRGRNVDVSAQAQLQDMTMQGHPFLEGEKIRASFEGGSEGEAVQAATTVEHPAVNKQGIAVAAEANIAFDHAVP